MSDRVMTVFGILCVLLTISIVINFSQLQTISRLSDDIDRQISDINRLADQVEEARADCMVLR